MPTDFSNVALYSYGLLTVITGSAVTTMHTQFDEDSLVVPLSVLFLVFVIIVSYVSITSDLCHIRHVQKSSVNANCIILFLLVYSRMWQSEHLYFGTSAVMINVTHLVVSAAALVNREWFGAQGDVRRVFFYVIPFLVLSFPTDIRNSQVVFFRVVLFLITYFMSLSALVYTESSLISDEGGDVILFLTCSTSCVLYGGRFLGSTCAIGIIAYYLRICIEHYLTTMTPSSVLPSTLPKMAASTTEANGNTHLGAKPQNVPTNSGIASYATSNVRDEMKRSSLSRVKSYGGNMPKRGLRDTAMFFSTLKQTV